MKIEDIEFADAVISIPKNAVFIQLRVKSFELGELVETEATLDMQDIRDAFDRFEATIAGAYPKYTLTEKGMRSLEENWEDYRDDDRWDTSDRD